MSVKNVLFAVITCSILWLLPMSLTATDPCKLPSVRNLKLNGLMTYDNHKDGNIFGLYSYSVNNPSERKLLTLMPFVAPNGGAVYRNGKFYMFQSNVEYGYVMSASYSIYDATTGSLLKTKNMSKEDAHTVYMNTATTAAVNPTTGDVYACSYSYHAATKSLSYVLSKWDLEGMSKDSIASLERGMRVMAVAPDGTLYGITMRVQNGEEKGGMLVKINTQTGELTSVGKTGVDLDYFQSAVIDKNTGVFYWFGVDTKQQTKLYTVDLTTGKATSIGELPGADQVLAAYVPNPAAVDGAPSSASNLMARFTDGSLEGVVSFDTPSETYDGKELIGDLSYEIVANGTIVASGTAQANTHIETPIVVTASGNYLLQVILKNTIGESPKIDTNLYIGQDTPKAVLNLKASREGNTNTVSWAVPTETVNGGYMNPENVTYRIKRTPGDTVLETAFLGTKYTEDLTAEYITAYKYIVTPCNGEMRGTSTTSNAVKVGESLKLPFTEDFSDKNSFDFFDVINANHDANKWDYHDGTARYRGSFTKVADDWLVLSPIKMKKGYSYDLSYDVAGTSNRYTQKLTLMMGNQPTPEAMTTIVRNLTEYKTRSFQTEKVCVKPEADGVYYIGFHVTSESSQGNLLIDNIKVSIGKSTAVPGSVQNLKVTAAPLGELKASLIFTSPTLTAEKEPLEDLTKFVILRNGEKVGEIQATGVAEQKYNYTDESVPNGKNIYTVFACNSAGVGAGVNDTVYVGLDVPKAPTRLVFKDNNDATGHLTWAAAEDKGENNGYVNPSEVTYIITNGEGVLIAQDVKGTEYSLTGLYHETPQKTAKFMVQAKNAIGVSAVTTINDFLLGLPFVAPYKEGFDNAKYQNGPWISNTIVGKSYNGRWTPRPDQDHDGNGGSADFQGYEKGATARLSSPKIDISQMENPQLSLWYLFKNDFCTSLKLQVSIDGGEWQDVADLTPQQNSNIVASGNVGSLESTEPWREALYSLASYKSKNVRIGLLAQCMKPFNFAYVDQVSVYDASTTSIAQSSIELDESRGIIVALNGKIVKSGNINQLEIRNLPAGIYLIKTASGIRKIVVP